MLTNDQEALIHATGSPLLILGRNTEIIYSSDALKGLLQRLFISDAQELCRILKNEHYPTLFADTEEVLSSHKNLEREIILNDQNKYQCRLSPLKLKDGQFGACLSINYAGGSAFTARDTNPQLKTDNEQINAWSDARPVLLEKDKIFSLLRQAPAMISVHEGKDHVFVFSNQSSDQYIGKRDTIGLSLLEAVPELEGHQILKNFDEVFRSGKSITLYSVPTQLRKEGYSEEFETHYFDMQFSPWRDDYGNVLGVISFSYDVTEKVLTQEAWEKEIAERKQREDELHQSEELLKSMIEQMPSGVTISEAPSGRMLLQNKAALEILGHLFIKSEDTSGYAKYGAIHPDGTPYRPEEYPLARALHGEHVHQEEMIYRKGDGSVSVLSVSAAPLLDKHGNIIRGVCTFFDIHSIKETQRALQEAKTQAERASRAKEDFLATMSHEIRTPLNAIIGLTHLLLKSNPSKQQLNRLNTLLFSSKSLKTLIDNILDFSKIEAGKVELEAIPFRLDSLLDSIYHAHLPLADEKDNSLLFSVDDQVPQVLQGDPYKLAQVLNNLISNANKFTQAGQICVTVKADGFNNRLADLDFNISDNGIGIPKEKLVYIFDKFSQADSTTQRFFGGTGLGLSISKSLLYLMGSDLHVQSEEGKGSVFHFKLRLPLGDETQMIAEKTVLSKKSTGLELKNVRLLLVEDMAINRMVVQQYLQEWWQQSADEAVSGEEALEKVRKNQYDLILMDIRMPGIDGKETSKRIRLLDEHYAKIPIIALTADVGILHNKEESEVFDAVVTKPFDPDQLSRTIFSLIQARAPLNPSMDPGNEIGLKDSEPNAPNFELALENFDSSYERQQKFLTLSLTSLKSFRTEFDSVFAERSLEKMEDAMHKVKPLFILLGLDSFYHQMYELRKQMEAGLDVQELISAHNEVILKLDDIIAKTADFSARFHENDQSGVF
ncbi:MAG: ATP-binding protein [Cyclobacteriaceae bacterium]